MIASRRNTPEHRAARELISRESAFQDVFADYFAGKNSRYLPTPKYTAYSGSGADYHYRSELDYLRIVERSREWDRNNMVVGQAVNRLGANVVREGFTLDPMTGDPAIDADLKAYWKEYSESPELCDYAGEKTFHELETLVLRHITIDGDLLVLPTKSGALQFVENHLLRTPHGGHRHNIIHGVQVDDRRRPRYYHFAEQTIDPWQAPTAAHRFRSIAARRPDGFRNVWHLFFPKRFSQTRGVSALAPAAMPIQYHDDLQFATMIKAKVASFYAIFREYADPETVPQTGNGRQSGPREEASQSQGPPRTYQQGVPGQEIKGDPGEKLTGFSPKIPNAEFFPHVQIILTLIAINLDMPMQVLLLDPRQTNFSGWRGAIDQARLRFRQIQKLLVAKFHRPAYAWQVSRWMAGDRILQAAQLRGDVNLFAHRWHPPKWPYIEPLKDAAADDMRISRNLAAPSQVISERGGDYDETLELIVGDRSKLIRRAWTEAQTLNKECDGLNVNWRELAYGHKTDGVKLKFDTEIDTTSGGEETNTTQEAAA